MTFDIHQIEEAKPETPNLLEILAFLALDSPVNRSAIISFSSLSLGLYR
jgi:hypothetical protein